MNVELYNLIMTNGPGTLLLIVTLFCGKNLIEYFFKESIELKKSELAQNLDNHKKQLSGESKFFQHELDTRLSEFNIRYFKLHNDRGEIIEKLYAKLVKLNTSMEILTHPMKTHSNTQDFEEYENELIINAEESYNSLNDFYQIKKIFFQEDTTKVIDKILDVFKTAYFNYNDYGFYVKGTAVEDGEIIESRKKMKDAYLSVKNEIPKVKKNLEDEFRELLGVEKT
tara:strand:+ start:799 stop:1476 length:678 start_codon:yes stop_codon:yes gene_type:complete